MNEDPLHGVQGNAQIRADWIAVGKDASGETVHNEGHDRFVKGVRSVKKVLIGSHIDPQGSATVRLVIDHGKKPVGKNGNGNDAPATAVRCRIGEQQKGYRCSFAASAPAKIDGVTCARSDVALSGSG